MIDLKKLKALKIIGYVFLVIVAVVVGVGIGQTLSGGQTKTTKTEAKQETTETALTQEQVEDFLISYFTKKDLGEHRTR